MDALRSSITALNGRLRRRNTQSPKGNASKQRSLITGKNSYVQQDSQVSLLKSSLEKLSLVNSENTKKVKLVESALKDLSP